MLSKIVDTTSYSKEISNSCDELIEPPDLDALEAAKEIIDCVVDKVG